MSHVYWKLRRVTQLWYRARRSGRARSRPETANRVRLERGSETAAVLELAGCKRIFCRGVGAAVVPTWSCASSHRGCVDKTLTPCRRPAESRRGNRTGHHGDRDVVKTQPKPIRPTLSEPWQAFGCSEMPKRPSKWNGPIIETRVGWQLRHRRFPRIPPIAPSNGKGRFACGPDCRRNPLGRGFSSGALEHQAALPP